MADDKKVKKKKTKKAEKEPEPAPAPEPEPAPAEGDDWLSAATEPDPEPTPAEEPGSAPEGEAPPAEEAPLQIGEDGEVAEPPPAPKKKPQFYVHWNRRKPKFYDYNFDYGANYYSSVVNYLNSKPLGSLNDIPRRMAWAERGIISSLERKSRPDVKTENILANARSSIRSFESFQRDYTVEPGFRKDSYL